MINKDDIRYDMEIRPYTFLKLSDYDWMEYRLQAYIPMNEKEKSLTIEFIFNGFDKCKLLYHTNETETKKCTVIEFPCEVFERYLKEYMTVHMESWNSNYAFDGSDIVIRFFNEVVSNATETSIEEYIIQF